MVNEPRNVWVRMCVDARGSLGFVVMTDNDITQTKLIGHNVHANIPSSFTSNSFHIVIENVCTNMGTSTNDMEMKQSTKLHINNDEYTLSCTWTSTVEPDNVTMELDCEVMETSETVETSSSIIIAKCGPDIWSDSVFNRVPMYIGSGAAYVSRDTIVNEILFNTLSFSTEGSITQSWDGSTQYKVTANDATSLAINDQFTIKDLPKSFVSHCVNIGAKALLGKDDAGIGHAMFTPPNDP